MAYEITGHTVLTGLLGSPVAHSISPMMHNEAFASWSWITHIWHLMLEQIT